MSGELVQVIPAESVRMGHPDKIADKIANRELDMAMGESKKVGGLARMGFEVGLKGDLEKGGTVILAGEVTLPNRANFDPIQNAIEAIADAGYTDPDAGFSTKSEMIVRITRQSIEIDRDVTKRGSKKKVGNGDQGIFIGGAIVDDGPNYMPMPIMVARGLTNRMDEVFRSGELPFLRPDGKSQVGVQYVNGLPVRIHNLTLAAAHDPLVEPGYVYEQLIRSVINPVCDSFNLKIDDKTKIIINGGKRGDKRPKKWTVYGPLADSGWANRKLVVDTYGARFAIGGGGLNGKDPTKADVTLQVAARWGALFLVKNNLARIAQVRIGCTIGQTEIDSLDVETFGTGKKRDDMLADIIEENLDFSIGSIIEQLRMNEQKYEPLASGGWFGRPDYPWEQVPSL